jgi:hypothetical protein
VRLIRAIPTRPKALSDIVRSPENRAYIAELVATAEKILAVQSGYEGIGEKQPPKKMTLHLISLCEKGVTVYELLAIREFRTLLMLDDGKVPSRQNLSMRLMRYWRQNYLKRRRDEGWFRYRITRKGENYRPNRTFISKVRNVFSRLRNDPRYWTLLSHPSSDKALEALELLYAKDVERRG